MWNESEVPFELRNFKFWLVSRLDDVEAIAVEDQPETLLMELYSEEYTGFAKAVAVEKRARDNQQQQYIIHYELKRLEDHHERQRRSLQAQYGYTERGKHAMYDLQRHQQEERDRLHKKLRYMRKY
jgi:hypothetical protein